MTPLASSLRSSARNAGLIVAALGAAVLVGWTFDVQALKSVVPGLTTMKVNAAIALALAGVSLARLAHAPVESRPWRAEQVLAGVVVLIGLLTLGEYVTGWSFGIDELVFRDPSGDAVGAPPGRMGINSALAFVLLGLALLLLDTGRSPSLPGQVLALAGGAVALAAVVGYLYGVVPLYGIRSHTRMALHTALAVVLLAIGILFARPDRGIMAALTSDGAGGRMARRFLPAALGVPIVLGWFSLYGGRAALYETEFGLSLLVTAIMGVFGALAWVTAASLNRADARLRESEARKTATLEAALDCIITIDHRGRITEFNQAAERVFGYRRTDAIGQELATLLIPPAFRERHHQGLARYLATGEGTILGRRLEMPALRADGTEFPIELTVTRLPSEGPPMFTGFVRDITERRELEDQLRQAQKLDAVGRLAGGIAHDFNNLLTIIGGRARFAVERLTPASPAQRDLDTIIGAAGRAESLTRQLLAFGRKQVLRVEVLDLGVVVENMRRLLERTIPENIVIATTVAPDVGRVKADPTQVEQVIMNLVVNARDAMPRGGRLTLEVSNVELDDAYARTHPDAQPGSYVMLAVSDTGSGMDRETVARIFEPFFTTKEPGKGTGLGLATVYGIVKQSHGHVTVYSEPGHGTTFKIYFARETDPAAPASTRPADAPTRGSETILLVDDDGEVIDLAQEILATAGYRVLTARHPDEALAVAARHPGTIHLVVTDVVMPKLSGPQLFERLRASRPDARVLYMSGFADDAMLRHGVLEAGRMFMPKPFTRQSLTAKVREILEAVRR